MRSHWGYSGTNKTGWIRYYAAIGGRLSGYGTGFLFQGAGFKTNGWLQGQFSLLSFRAGWNESQEVLET